MSHRRLLTLAVCVLGACPSPEPTSPSLAIAARPSSIDDLGGSTVLTLTALNADGTTGTGSVTLTAAVGTLSSTSVALDTAGKGTATFSCDSRTQAGCMGRVTIDAAWSGATARTRVQVGGLDAGQAGGTGGGSAGGTAGAGGGSAGSDPDAGEADGGEPDAGGADGGQPDGGGGTFDGGGYDAGARDSGTPLVLDAGQVYLIGTLIEGRALYTLSDMAPDAGGTATSDRILLLPADADRTSAVIRPGGTLLYLEDSASAVLLEVAADEVLQGQDGGAVISVLPPPAANDIVVPTPACMPTTRFWVRPDTGGVVYACGPTDYYEGSTQLTAYAGLELLALGPNGLALGREGTTAVVRDATGLSFPVTGLMGRSLSTYFNNLYGRQVRATPTGFLLTLGQPMTDAAPCELWSIGATGAAANLGSFAALPMGLMMGSPCEGKLRDDRTLWSIGRVGSTHVTLVRPLGVGPASVYYAEPDGGPSQLDVYPPRLFTFIDPSDSVLVTGP
ncbi:MAG: hypothetical protein JNK82_22610 [Myxococcaceae bacterium]|nr:hypothetical protein [Myxococcaceae bacterium]